MPGPAGVYTNRTFPTPPAQGFTSVESPVQVNVAPSADDNVGLFYAYQFPMGADGGYIGLQTMVFGITGEPYGARFSLWQGIDAEGPGLAEPFGGEGTGYTCAIKLNWKRNRQYRLSVRKIQKSGSKSQENWWAGFVDHWYIGRIRVPDAWTGIGWWASSWTEYYYPSAATCGDIPAAATSEVIWGLPVCDGTIPPTSTELNTVPVDANNCPGSSCVDLGAQMSRQRMRWGV